MAKKEENKGSERLRELRHMEMETEREEAVWTVCLAVILTSI